MNKNLTKKLRNIIIVTIFLFVVGFMVTSACGTSNPVFGYEIIAADEKGVLEYNTAEESMGTRNIVIEKDKYPGNIEVLINNKIKNPEPYPYPLKYGEKYYYHYFLGEYISEYYPIKFSVAVFQDGKEIYSAKWKIYDSANNWLLTDLHLLSFILLFLAILLIPWKIIAAIFNKKGPSLILILIIISLLLLFSISLLVAGHFISNLSCII